MAGKSVRCRSSGAPFTGLLAVRLEPWRGIAKAEHREARERDSKLVPHRLTRAQARPTPLRGKPRERGWDEKAALDVTAIVMDGGRLTSNFEPARSTPAGT